MNDDLGEVLNKFSNILKEKNIDINSNSSDSELDIDIETILKIKDIISKVNKNQNSSRNKLLYSLKPYLEESKQEKLDNYIRIANLLSVMEEMEIGLSFLEKKEGYDFILIITLILLIF